MNQSTNEDYKKIVGSRIKQARLMAGYNTITAFNEQFPDWAASRIGNYENGTSLPNPQDIQRIAKETKTNPCWIIFGIGSIRATDRDIQAIRFQNFSHLYEAMSKVDQAKFRKALKLKPTDIKRYLENPYLKITDTICRKIEKHLDKPKNWMEQQHIEIDGMGDYFPEDVREIISIYSNLNEKGKKLFMEMARTINTHCDT